MGLAVRLGKLADIVALIAVPTFNLGKKAKLNRFTIWIPVVSALLIWLLGVSPILIILCAGIGGFFFGKFARKENQK